MNDVVRYIVHGTRERKCDQTWGLWNTYHFSTSYPPVFQDHAIVIMSQYLSEILNDVNDYKYLDFNWNMSLTAEINEVVDN